MITATLLGFYYRKTLAFDNPDLFTFNFLKKHVISKACAERLYSMVLQLVDDLEQLGLAKSEVSNYEKCLPALAEKM